MRFRILTAVVFVATMSAADVADLQALRQVYRAGLERYKIVGSSFALFRAFQATRRFGLVDVLVLLAFMTLGSLVQVPGVGGGVQAASIVALTGIYGLRLEAATGIAILLWMVGTLAIVPFGLACAFHEGLNWSKLKLLSAKQIIDDPET